MSFNFEESLEAFEKALDKDLADPNGYWNTLEKQRKVQDSRFDKFEKWLETNEFEPTFQKLLQKNGEVRSEWCYKKNYQKYGTPLMQFLCEYVSDRTEPKVNEKIDSDFESGLWEFKGYWFQLICGQGCFWRIYNSDLEIVEDV